MSRFLDRHQEERQIVVIPFLQKAERAPLKACRRFSPSSVNVTFPERCAAMHNRSSRWSWEAPAMASQQNSTYSRQSRLTDTNVLHRMPDDRQNLPIPLTTEPLRHTGAPRVKAEPGTGLQVICHQRYRPACRLAAECRVRAPAPRPWPGSRRPPPVNQDKRRHPGGEECGRRGRDPRTASRSTV
jgi:hypothetical protein